MYSYIGMTSCIIYIPESQSRISTMNRALQVWLNMPQNKHMWVWTASATQTIPLQGFWTNAFSKRNPKKAKKKGQVQDATKLQLYCVISWELSKFQIHWVQGKNHPPKREDHMILSSTVYLYSVTPTILHPLILRYKKWGSWCIYLPFPFPSHLFLPCFYPPRCPPNCRCTQHNSAQDPAISWQEENGWPPDRKLIVQTRASVSFWRLPG